MRFGLLGRKLDHSYSPQIHKYFEDYPYCLFAQEPEALPGFFRERDFSGINITIPYKKTVLDYCDDLTETARAIGAVNTIVNRNGKLIGHNTDCFGFRYMLRKSGLSVKGKKVLILGSGGASITARFVLNNLGAKVIIISRSGENNYQNLDLHADAAMIVNCTPVGMYPNNGHAPLSLVNFPALEGVLDIIYNPAKTKLLMDAEGRGLVALNGLWMLIAQAKESAEWFTGKIFNDSIIDEIYSAISLQTKNIVLIGMPGCGKSAVGSSLSVLLGRIFWDADHLIREKAGCDIPNIFTKQGEAGFRAIETAVLADIAKGSGAVIATGGGCVTREENLPLLRQNSIIIWLKREINQLPKDGRPLSQTTDLEEMYRVRKPKYERFADFAVENNGTPEETANAIVRLLKGKYNEDIGY